jgi:branched-chain amino acid transport system permease protein
MALKRQQFIRWVVRVASFAFLFSIPLFLHNPYYLRILTIGGITIFPVLGLNLLTGITGQLSICQAGFYGIGAYASALLVMKLHLSFWMALPLATLFAGLAGFGLGIPSLRFRGHYLVIVTIGFTIIIYEIFLNWVSVTRGPMGIINIPPPDPLFGLSFVSQKAYYYLCLLLVLGGIWVMRKIYRSKLGVALLAIREDETAAEIMGIDVVKYKLLSFTLSALYAGFGGSLFAHYLRILSPDLFTLSESVNYLLMIVLGGMGSIPGAVFGAFFVTITSEYLRFLMAYRLVVYGLVLIVVIIFLPLGAADFLRKIRRLSLARAVVTASVPSADPVESSNPQT